MEGRVLQTAEFVKIRLNGFLCRALIGPNLPGNIVLASLETTKWFAQVTQGLTAPPHQGPAPLERGPELSERGAQRGASSTEEPQPA